MRLAFGIPHPAPQFLDSGFLERRKQAKEHREEQNRKFAHRGHGTSGFITVSLLSLSLSIYIYMRTHICMCMHIYIYIYIYIYLCPRTAARGA